MNDEFYAPTGQGGCNIPERALALLKRIDPDQWCQSCRGLGALPILETVVDGPRYTERMFRWEICPECKGNGVKNNDR